MREMMTKDIGDEYELNQLVPVEDNTPDDSPSTRVEIGDLVADLPESVSIEMRMAVFEAVLDEVVEETIDEAEPDTPIVGSQIAEKIEPLVDNAVALHLVSSAIYPRINPLIAKHLRKRNDQFKLVEKAALYATDALVRMSDDTDAVVDEVVESTPVENSDNIREEVIDAPDLTIDNTVPEKVAESMLWLYASTINKRKATALVSKRISGAMLQDTLHKLRYQLPDKFKRKFNVQ